MRTSRYEHIQTFRADVFKINGFTAHCYVWDEEGRAGRIDVDTRTLAGVGVVAGEPFQIFLVREDGETMLHFSSRPRRQLIGPDVECLWDDLRKLIHELGIGD